MAYRALFLDIDDTLFNFKASSHLALKQTFVELQLPYPKDGFEQFTAIDEGLWQKQRAQLLSVSDVLKQRFEIFCEVLHLHGYASRFQDVFQEQLSHAAVLEPQVVTVLTHLKQRYKLYAASNGLLQMQLARLQHAQLKHFFTDVYVSDAVGYAKPNPLFFEHCLKASQFDSTAVLMIGDSLEADMLGAYQSSIDRCWYNPKQKKLSLECPLTFEINCLSELVHLL